MIFRTTHFALAAAISVFIPGYVAMAADLQPVDAVLDRVGKGLTSAQAGPSEPAKLLLDIIEFRRKSASLPVDRAAKDWLALWDRVRTIDAVRAAADYAAYDIETNAVVGLRSLIAALPQPTVWPELQKQAIARAKLKPDDTASLGLRFITELLTGDKTAVLQSLTAFERIANSVNPDARESTRFEINRTRAMVYKLYGSREQIAEGFAASLDAQALYGYGMPVEVPDLVGLVGETRTEALLRQALRKPVSLHIAEGEATRALARKLALNEIAGLHKPQWGLIDTIGTASLYEALRKRFDPVEKEEKKAKSVADEETSTGFDYTRRQADTFYFLDLVIAGRYEEAERIMARVATGNGNLSVPKQAMAALVRLGKNEAVYAFLSKLLERRPQLQAWDSYLEQASYLGLAKDAIALIDTISKRSDLPPYLRAELRDKRLHALLGADQIDAALAGYRELLATPPTRDEDRLAERTKAAIRLAALGRVLKQPALSELGFVFAKQAIALPTKSGNHWKSRVLSDLLAELRQQGRAVEAQTIALAEIDRESVSPPGGAAFVALNVEPAKRVALIELAGIYDAAGRTSDVLRLLNEVGLWGARDVVAMIAEKDSLGTPLGLMAARALRASGKIAEAKTSVQVLLDQLPGYDPAYQLLVELYGALAPAELDRLYALDQFEERPLIWKAVALSAANKNDEAEKTILRAIAIDPSDGEQGQNDRLRAYAVLAGILESKGDVNSAKIYRRAVAAIRLSEQADALYKLGLYQRAFAGYRAALDQFSDAYCIQSRLAVQLGKMGAHEEALKHYRRAYELMPDSFGRVESHCFGCESVFADSTAQTVAEQVFTDLLKRHPDKPQVHYMLGYLRQIQGRYEESLGLFRQAVALDPEYLNAWKHLHELGEKTYIKPGERDIARLKLFELDPRQHHVRYELNQVVDLAQLWHALQQVTTSRELNPQVKHVYPLDASTREQDQALTKLPPEMRAQVQRYMDLKNRMTDVARNAMPTLTRHELMIAALRLMGDRSSDNNDE